MSKAIILKSLNLINFATFENVQIQFDQGFNAIIGETGSGKSLIIEALQLILGSRADRKIIRKDCDFSSIEASFSFDNNEVSKYFDSLGFPVDGNEIVIKRIIYKDGNGKCFLNFQSCNVSLLNNVSRKFIDLVGQFENQKLLSETYQITLLDQYADLKNLSTEYKNLYAQILEDKQKLSQLKSESSQREQKLDFIRYQLDEITKCNPSTNEEEILNQKKFEFQNREHKLVILNQLLNLISENSDNDDIFSKIKLVKSLIEKNSKLFPETMIDSIQNLHAQIEDLSFNLNKEIDSQDNDVSIDEIVDKLDLYTRVKKKFGPSIDNVWENFKSLENEYRELLGHEDNLSQLEKSLSQSESRCYEMAVTLHQKRLVAANDLANKLTLILQELKMVGATVKIELQKTDSLNANGLTILNFLCQTNPGEGFYKISDIASGGELSRILLALRQLLSSKDSISVFLFDEIDTGLGGETALCIGKALKNVSQNSQVIAITHLPQIAGQADKLISVSKNQNLKSTQTRTFSQIKEIVGLSQMKKEVESMTPLN